LEVLFYGPVSYSAYVLGKCAKGVLSYLLILLFLSAYFLLSSLSTNLGLSTRFIGFIVFSLLLSTSVIAFGILVSTLTDTVRGAVLVFVVIVGGLLAIQFSHEALMEMDESRMAPQLSYLRDTLSTVRSAVKWISPFYYIHKGMEAVSLGSAGKYLFSATSSLLYSGVALALSIGTLKGKGVRKTRGE
jgi:ABC-type multidrug transport system permease subunit